MIRTFIAIELPESVREMIDRFQREASEQNFRPHWVKPENIHITLKFIGDTSEELVEKITADIFKTPPLFSKFTIALGGTDIFPNMRRPRVYWSKIVKGVPELIQIADLVNNRCASLSVPREERPFRAHVTLGRFKTDPPPDLVQKFISPELMATGDLQISRMVFMKSVLRKEGPEYSVLAEHNFD